MIPLSNVLTGGGITRVIPPHHLCWEGIPMKRPWAFICAASTTKSEALRRYCRALYTLGYVPVCPPIQDGQYLVLADPTERADYNEIVREKILRCPAFGAVRAENRRHHQRTDRSCPQIRTHRFQPARAADGGREGRGAPLLRPYRLAHYLLAGFASIAFGRPNADSWGVPPTPRFKTIYERTW